MSEEKKEESGARSQNKEKNKEEKKGKRWIPACAGMTEREAGMTPVKQGFTGQA
ncbi:MAG: hypothetical protein U9N08_00050 [Candidatus Caldatribacteriota bacterium]|nr:hypothetical protein [Candidatus Caldatribacteriota bacterium]